MSRMLWRYRAEYLVFRTLVCIVRALPQARCVQLAHALATLMHRGLPRRLTRYEVARDNLRRAFSGISDEQADALIYGMWVHLFRMVSEIIHLPRKLSLHNVVDAIQFRGKSQVLACLCSGRPMLLLSGHFGNWEMAISVFGLFGFRMALVARALDNPFLDRWFLKFRKSTGHAQINKKGGGDEMTGLLDRAGQLALLSDQDAGSGGMFVNFFGHPASTHKSIALLAMHHEALVCVGYARRLPETCANGFPRYELGFEEVIDPRDYAQDPDALLHITQRYTLALERAVRRSPEQYFWVHRRWKSTPRSRVERRQLRKAG